MTTVKFNTSWITALVLTMCFAGTQAMAQTKTPQAHADKTIAAAATAKTEPVTWKNWVRAESDKYFKSYVDIGAFGKFLNIRQPTPIDKQNARYGGPLSIADGSQPR